MSVNSSADDDSVSLGEELTQMNIDQEFNVWQSFRASKGRNNQLSSSQFEDLESLDISTSEADRLLEKQARQWSKRWKRDEIYSLKYKPSSEEQQELNKLDESFKAAKKGSIIKALKPTSSQKSLIWDSLRNQSDPPYSILLKRGPCHYESPEHESLEAEVYLLTQGLVVALVTTKDKELQRRLIRAVTWADVKHIRRNSQDADKAWELVLNSEELCTFTCSTAAQQKYWLKALEHVFVEYYERTSSRTDLGWQYKIVHKPAFSMAVTGEMDSVRPDKHLLTKLDRYNGYTPLHYAVRCSNPTAVRTLLKIGSDPNYPDSDGSTSVDCAVRDSAPSVILELLKESGGVFRNDAAGALFGQVAAVTEKRAKEKEVVEDREIEEKKKAEAAQAQLSENVRHMQQRGEKIGDMSNKANNLNEEAHELRSMASQLKEKTRKQSKWLPF